jgi:hypothetical protein
MVQPGDTPAPDPSGSRAALPMAGAAAGDSGGLSKADETAHVVERIPPPTPLDLAFGVGQLAYRTAFRGALALSRVASPLTGLLRHPPGLPPDYQPEKVIARVAQQGAPVRHETEARFGDAILQLASRSVQAVMRNLDLVELIAQIDPIRLMKAIDIDRVMKQVDVGAIVEKLPVDTVLDHLDLDAVVDRVNLERIVKRLDLDTIIAGVDVDRVAGEIDIEAIIARIDMVGIARNLIEELDLPAIIRESSGMMASEAVRDVRWQSMSADQTVNSAFARLRGGRRRAAQESIEKAGSNGHLTEDRGQHQPADDERGAEGEAPPTG